MTKFHRLALQEWDRRGYGWWEPCEECGRYIERGSAPHHTNPSGLGGERKHIPELFAFLCLDCHNSKHF